MMNPPLRSRPLAALQLNFQGGQRLFHVRSDSHADQGVVQQNLVDKQYDLDGIPPHGTWLKQHYQRLLQAGQRPLIVDVGANIGASAVWFALTFPEAIVVAVEPESENFRLLEMNTAGLAVQTLHAAVGGGPGWCTVIDTGMGEWGFRTTAAGSSTPGRVAQVGMEHLMGLVPGAAPFIVKMDIEGSEKEVFSADTAWLTGLPLLVVELHDTMFPGQGVSRPFLTKVAELDRDFVCRNETVFSIQCGLYQAIETTSQR